MRLTGGEPTLRPDLLQLCQQLAALPGLETLAMTTNGITLHRNLAQLQAAGARASLDGQPIPLWAFVGNARPNALGSLAADGPVPTTHLAQ